MDFSFKARGHKNVKATHRATIEFTRDEDLTPRGDCIVAVGAEKALKDLPDAFKEALRAGSRVEVGIECNGRKDAIRAFGSPRLTLKGARCMIIRKSGFACDRTLCVNADKAAADLNRELVEELRDGHSCKITLHI